MFLLYSTWLLSVISNLRAHLSKSAVTCFFLFFFLRIIADVVVDDDNKTKHTFAALTFYTQTLTTSTSCFPHYSGDVN